MFYKHLWRNLTFKSLKENSTWVSWHEKELIWRWEGYWKKKQNLFVSVNYYVDWVISPQTRKFYSKLPIFCVEEIMLKFEAETRSLTVLSCQNCLIDKIDLENFGDVILNAKKKKRNLHFSKYVTLPITHTFGDGGFELMSRFGIFMFEISVLSWRSTLILGAGIFFRNLRTRTIEFFPRTTLYSEKQKRNKKMLLHTEETYTKTMTLKTTQ